MKQPGTYVFIPEQMKPCSADTLEPYMTSTNSARYLTKNKEILANEYQLRCDLRLISHPDVYRKQCRTVIRKEQQEQVWQHFSLP